MNPTISIVLPTYNVSKYIDRCMASLLIQDNRDFEAIFVDDCGDDDSIKIIENRITNSKNIRVIKNQKNIGTFAAREHGVQEALGEYIFFLDPDDELPLNAISSLHATILESSSDVIFGKVCHIKDGNLLYEMGDIPDDAEYPNILASCILSRKYPIWYTAGKVYRKEILLKAYKKIGANSKPLIYGEDALLYYACLAESMKYKKLSDCIYKYHYNEHSITQLINPAKLISKANNILIVCDVLDNLVATNYASDADALAAANKIKNLLQLDAADHLLDSSLMLRGKKSNFSSHLLRAVLTTNRRNVGILLNSILLYCSKVLYKFSGSRVRSSA